MEALHVRESLIRRSLRLLPCVPTPAAADKVDSTVNVDSYGMDAVLNFRTLSVLGVQERVSQEYRRLLAKGEALIARNNLITGVIYGLSLMLTLGSMTLSFYYGALEVDKGCVALPLFPPPPLPSQRLARPRPTAHVVLIRYVSLCSPCS
jgi:hypothetical protein